MVKGCAMGMPFTTRSLVVICVASGSWSISFGLGSQVVTHWLNSLGASNTVIGLNHATYYLGLTLASLLAPRLMQRFGMRCAVAGMVVSGLSLAVFPWMGGPVGWFVCRLINGMASALSLIPLETLVSRDSSAEVRTRNFGFYAVALTLGGALGIWLGLHFFQSSDPLPFYLGGMLPLGAALLLLRGPAFAPFGNQETGVGSLAWKENFLSFGTGWCQGFLEGGMLAFLSLYLVALGMSNDTAGTLMGVTMIGVILFQVPVGWLADRLGRLPVLLGCYALVLASLVLVPWCEEAFWVGWWLFVLGASSGALYPLGLALLGDHVSEGALVRAYSWFLALECLGSQMGAAAMGKARDHWGEASMFGVGQSAVALVLIFGLVFHGLRWLQARKESALAKHQEEKASRAA
jgi:MFS family permease